MRHFLKHPAQQITDRAMELLINPPLHAGPTWPAVWDALVYDSMMMLRDREPRPRHVPPPSFWRD